MDFLTYIFSSTCATMESLKRCNKNDKKLKSYFSSVF